MLPTVWVNSGSASKPGSPRPTGPRTCSSSTPPPQPSGGSAASSPAPILGVPVPSRHLQGLDSLLSIVQMPAGVPVATFAVGDAGAHNAGLFAVALLAAHDPALREKLARFRAAQDAEVRATLLPASSPG